MVSIREELASLLHDHGLTQSLIAKEFGVSTATISQYLDGSYAGDIEKLDKRAKSYITNFLEQEHTEQVAIPIVKTTVYKNLFEIARTCHMRRKIGIAYGPAGIGKTRAVFAYVKENPGVILVEVDPVYSERDMLRSFYRTLFSGDQRGSVHEMFEAVVARLAGTKRMIIIDEAEYLRPNALDLLRRIWDKAHVGILMVGLERLRANLVGDRRNFAQLFSRVSISKNLGTLTPEDTEEIVKAALPEHKDLWETFHEHSKGIARNLENIIVQSVNISRINKKDVTVKLVEFAAGTLII
jgi:DNA transposition AAA+ family ATPase